LGSGREIVVQAREDLRPLSGTTDDTSVAAQGGDYESGLDAGEETPAAEEDRMALLPPLLIATVVAAGAGDTMEARRAAAKLERMGREFQREFVREEAEPREAIAGSEDG
jgi:hypothetical protein